MKKHTKYFIYGLIIGLMIGIFAMYLNIKHRRELAADLTELAADYARLHGDIANSIDNYTISRFFNPSNKNLTISLAAIYYENECFDLAVGELEKLKNDIKDENDQAHTSMLYCNLSSAYDSINEKEKSRALLNTALVIYPNLKSDLTAAIANVSIVNSPASDLLRRYQDCLETIEMHEAEIDKNK